METKQLVVVLAVVRNLSGEYLLGKRYEPAIASIHEKWNLLGGKLEYGETPEEAVVREVREESGLVVEVLGVLPKIFIRYREKTDGTKLQIAGLAYACVVKDWTTPVLTDPKVSEVQLFNPGSRCRRFD